MSEMTYVNFDSISLVESVSKKTQGERGVIFKNVQFFLYIYTPVNQVDWTTNQIQFQFFFEKSKRINLKLFLK